MILRVHLNEVLSPDLLLAHVEHICNFLLMEGVTPDPDDLGATVVTERQVKELMAELAHDLGR